MSSRGWPDRATGKQVLDAAAYSADVHVLGQLAQYYQGMVYNLAYRILGDANAAASVTEQAFVRAYAAVKRPPQCPFKTYLLRLVTKACHDRLRAARRRARRSTPVSHSLDPGETPARDQLLQAGILTLPAEQRIVLVLSDLLRLSYEEIAEITGLPLSAVGTQLSRARVGLRDYLLART
jgi:RNA polymerase sigma-70 factor (ECF subfamily)